MSEQYSIAEARHDLAALVRRLENARHIQITRRGKTVAVLVSIQEYERLTAERVGLWEAYTRFRETTNLAELQIDGTIFDEVRGREPGREVKL
jgi:prevent-host-death family protein